MKTILLVEDDEVLAQTLQRRLNKNDYSAEVVNSAHPVMDDLEKYEFDMYLIDLRLGKQSGLNLIQPLRDRYPNAKIIVMTGFASIATAVNAIKLGADDYLPKPLDFKLLLDTLEGRKEIQTDVKEEVMSPERVEWEHIQKVLAENNGNVSATARELGMYRRTLQRKLAKKPVNH